MASESVSTQIDALETFPTELRQLLDEVPEAALNFCPDPNNSWSVAELLGYLMVFDARWGNRIRQMVTSSEPKFVADNPADVVRRFDFERREVDDLFQGFASRRAERVEFLRTLRDDQMSRTGTDPKRGLVTMQEAIGILVENDRRTLQQIKQVVEAHRQQSS